MSNFSSWSDTVSSGVSDAVHSVVVAIPDFIAALVVLLLGVIVGVVLKALVVRLMRAVNVRKWTDQIGWNKVFPGEYDLANLVGDLVKWFFIIVFLLQALTIVHLTIVSNIVARLLAYVPNVIAAAVVLFVGFVVADLTGRIVVSAATAVGATTAALLGNVARYSIIAVVVFTALAQLGVNTLFLDRLFTAIVVMLALAGGLAFGLGGRDAAKDAIDTVRKNVKG